MASLCLLKILVLNLNMIGWLNYSHLEFSLGASLRCLLIATIYVLSPLFLSVSEMLYKSVILCASEQSIWLSFFFGIWYRIHSTIHRNPIAGWGTEMIRQCTYAVIAAIRIYIKREPRNGLHSQRADPVKELEDKLKKSWLLSRIIEEFRTLELRTPDSLELTLDFCVVDVNIGVYHTGFCFIFLSIYVWFMRELPEEAQKWLLLRHFFP